MAFGLKLATLLYLANTQPLAQAQNNPNCDVSSTVTCTFTDTNEICDDIEVLRGEQCKNRPVSVAYNFCNLNSAKTIDLLPDVTIAKFKLENITLQEDPMVPLECRSITEERIISTCDGKLTASLKVEGWIQGFESVTDYYCYAYDFLNVKITTPAPTPSPKTSAPTVRQGPPEFDLDIECFGQHPASGNFIVPCDQLPVITREDDCIQNLMYVYTITNRSPYKIRPQGLSIRKANGVDNLEVSSAPIAPNGKYVTDSIFTKDLCMKNGNVFKHDAIAIAANVNTGEPGFADDDYSFTSPELPFYWELNSNVNCFINGCEDKSCNDYLNELKTRDECIVDVTLTYDILNTGLGCESIDRVEATIDERLKNLVPITGINSCGEKRFCPGESWKLTDDRTIDICSLANQKVPFHVGINDDEMQVGHYIFDPVYLNDYPLDPPKKIECDGHPQELYFKFEERLCSESNNSLDSSWRRELTVDESSGLTEKEIRELTDEVRSLKKSDKRNDSDKSSYYFSCDDYCEFTDPSTVIISDCKEGDIYYKEDNVRFGDIIVAKASDGYIGANTKVEIKNQEGRTVQEFTFHSSCSRPIYTGDTFGALKLVGWKNDDGIVESHR